MTLFDIEFERYAFVYPNGDIDEFLALTLHNVGLCSYSFLGNDQWVKFTITDSVAECISAYDAAEASLSWAYREQEDGFLVAGQPTLDILPHSRRTFGAHILRRNRLWVQDNEIHFDDPVPLNLVNGLNVRRSIGLMTVIFPEHEEGWQVSTADATATSSRTATWNFMYGPSGWKQIRATARTPAANPSTVVYDDIMAELQMLIGRELCGEAADVSELLRKVNSLRHETVRESVNTLRRGVERDRTARLAQFRSVLQSMQRSRLSFSRSPAERTTSAALAASRAGAPAGTAAVHVPPPRPGAAATSDTTCHALDGEVREIKQRSGMLHCVAAPSVDVFISYAPPDEAHRQVLEKHLTVLVRQGLVRTWHLGKVGAGEPWEQALAARLGGARLVLLLVSADYLADDPYWREMERAVERHHADEVRVIPILVDACDCEHAPFGALRPLPSNRCPVTSWPNQSEAWADVARGIRRAVEELGSAPTTLAAEELPGSSGSAKSQTGVHEIRASPGDRDALWVPAGVGIIETKRRAEIHSLWTLHMVEGRPDSLYSNHRLPKGDEMEGFFDVNRSPLPLAQLGPGLREAAEVLWNEVKTHASVARHIPKMAPYRRAFDHVSRVIDVLWANDLRRNAESIMWNREVERPKERIAASPKVEIQIAALSAAAQAAVASFDAMTAILANEVYSDAAARRAEWG